MNRTLALMLCILAIPSLSLAQSTAMSVTYAGQLKNAAGQGVSASMAMTFRLYEQAENGETIAPIS